MMLYDQEECSLSYHGKTKQVGMKPTGLVAKIRENSWVLCGSGLVSRVLLLFQPGVRYR
jgi:hypothetical protein